MAINLKIYRTTIKCLFLILLVCVVFPAFSQNQGSLSLDSCYKLARQNFPQTRQFGLIEKTRDYTVENAGKGYLPQFTLSGQATYQSAVTSIPFDIPHVTIPTYSRDQYKIYLEADQTIYDAGAIRNQKDVASTDAIIQKQNLEVSLYALKDRVDQIFFGILLLDEQIKQNDTLQGSIRNSTEQLQARVSNGVALKSGLDELKAELLQQEQNRVQLSATRKAYLDMLGVFTHQNFGESTILIKPEPVIVSNVIKRLELTLYDYQKNSYDIQDKILNSNNLPKLSFFVQGGYGRPGLNLLSNDFSFYYIGGLRLNWQLGGLYTLKNSRELLNINRQTADLQKETFLFNTDITLKQQNGEMVKLQQMILKDDEIIKTRTAVTQDAKQKMDNGTLTSHDYLSELNMENQARQNKMLHEIQLLQSQYNYKITTGN